MVFIKVINCIFGSFSVYRMDENMDYKMDDKQVIELGRNTHTIFDFNTDLNALKCTKHGPKFTKFTQSWKILKTIIGKGINKTAREKS